MHGYSPTGSEGSKHGYRRQDGSTIDLELEDFGAESPHIYWKHIKGGKVTTGFGGPDLFRHLRREG